MSRFAESTTIALSTSTSQPCFEAQLAQSLTLHIPAYKPLEAQYCGGRHGALSWLQTIQKEARCTVLSGHVLHLPFSDGFGDAIQAAVLNTGVHMNTDELCKFAVAARSVQTGAAFVCGWWIYICRVREGLRPQLSSMV